MNRLGIYLINGFFSAFIGLVIKIIETVVEHENTVSVPELFESMTKGALIGTISLFVLFHVFIRFKRKPIAGFISNFIVVAVLMAVVGIFDFITSSCAFNYYRWIVSFIMAEILSFLLASVWYRQMILYNDKLEKKKASIMD
ncbi:hypothetical protein [Candidatus Formimonas warabiya]|uniref:Uncharacterized protein n=1 Tax=Formimonas warabiya TaxID=1761012 RepID=A0A3G1KVZ5_FORW1|nr:hypothetical protein [Candidatus Formimonas warabiya]ATW26622.1 hypothetical protein DCMF_19365 [Candidatus Formimonas warabiya]